MSEQMVSITAEQARDVLALLDGQRESYARGHSARLRQNPWRTQAEIDDAEIAARMRWDDDHPTLASLRMSKDARRAARSAS